MHDRIQAAIDAVVPIEEQTVHVKYRGAGQQPRGPGGEELGDGGASVALQRRRLSSFESIRIAFDTTLIDNPSLDPYACTSVGQTVERSDSRSVSCMPCS